MLEAEVDAYLARIGAARPERADAASLRQLQHRHLLTVPFENLSIHLAAYETHFGIVLDRVPPLPAPAPA